MKLRLHRDSLRLRLTPADVRQLRETGSVSESTGFGPGAELVCRLVADSILDTRASLQAGVVEVRLPHSAVHRWADGDEIGIDAVQPIAPGRSLKILVEKDFECMHDADAAPGETFYPNPEKASC